MGLYEHEGRRNVRYYTNGKYVDHRRMIYKTVPRPGDVVSPFYTTTGRCEWRVVEVRFPENDHCMELHFEEVKS